MDWHLERKVWHDPGSIKGISGDDGAVKAGLAWVGKFGDFRSHERSCKLIPMAMFGGFNGGISWQHSEKERRFSKLKYYRYNSLICAQVTVVASELIG